MKYTKIRSFYNFDPLALSICEHPRRGLLLRVEWSATAIDMNLKDIDTIQLRQSIKEIEEGRLPVKITLKSGKKTVSINVKEAHGDNLKGSSSVRQWFFIIGFINWLRYNGKLSSMIRLADDIENAQKQL